MFEALWRNCCTCWNNKMRTTLHLLLLLIAFGGYTGQPTFTTETKKVGQSVSLECPRKPSELQAVLVWIRLASGRFPEVLDRMSAIDMAEPETGTSKSGHRITVKQEPGKFVLQISRVQKNDTALYYCFKWTTWVHKITFLNGVFLQVKDVPEAETAVTAVTNDESRSQCSFVSRSGNRTCEDGHNVYWLRAGPEDSNPNFIYTHDECEKVANGSIQKCVKAFPNNGDAGTYSCAVATCGHIFMAKATKVIIKDGSKCDMPRSVIFVLGSAVALSWIISAFLICKIKTKGCFYCKACRQTREELCSGVQQRTEDTLVYSAPTIVARKSGKESQTRARQNEDISMYTDVCLCET